MCTSSDLRVLHVAVDLDRRRGGTAQAPMSICRGLRQYGVDAEVVSVSIPGAERHSLIHEYPDVPAFEFRSSFPARFTNSFELRDWLEENVDNYDLVEIHEIFSFPPIYARQACVRRNVPYLLNTHGALIPSDLKKRRLLKLLFRRPFLKPLLRQAVALKAATPLEAEVMVTYGERTHKVVLPLPVEPLTGSGDGTRFRLKHGIPTDATVVTCMARIDPVKGIELLIGSLARLKAKFPKLWFLLVGTGRAEYLKSIEDRVAAEGMAGWTTIPGFLSGVDKGDALAATNLYVQLSYRENFCYTVAEALAAGLPCLLSDQIGLTPFVLAAGAGVACTPVQSDVDQALQTLLGSQGAWGELGRRGRKLFAESLSTKATIQQLIALYGRVVAQHPVHRV
jgi:glycosyltransferase involved in cell wall biosynthesis